MNSGISDSRRRFEIADRTRMGLEDDLEDLQTQLTDDLEWYEARIREVAQRAPEWTSVAPEKVVDLFRLEPKGLPEEGFLGPRMVAIGADAAEGFVEKWFDNESGELESRTDEFERDVRELLMFLEDVGARTGERADRAHQILEEWMESNLAHLDELRENDLEALQDLIGEGELETGLDAREEKAQLWEEQRKRADELRAIWDEFHVLVDEGADYAFGGLRDVAALVRRACEGLAGASPAIREQTAVEELFESTDLWGEDEQEQDRTRDRSSTGDARAPTEQLDGAGADGVGSDGWLRQPESGDREAPDRPDEGDTTPETDLLEEDRVSGPPESEREQEVSETEPILGRAEGDGELDDSRSEQLQAWRESKLEDTAPPSGSPPDESETSSEDGSQSGEPGEEPAIEEPATSEAAESEGEAAPAEPAAPEQEVPGEGFVPVEPSTTGSERRGDEPSPAEPTVASPAEVDETEAKCLRIRTEWRAIEWPALAAALGPPFGFLLMMVAMSLIRIAGAGVVPNPVAVWGWVEPAVGVAVVWIFCTPMLLGWRPRWDGWSFDFVQQRELRDEETFEIDGSGFSLGRVSIPWKALDSYRLRRWESEEDMYGWLLIVEPKYYEALQLIAAEPDRTRWENSSEPVVEPPADAWQVDRAALERLSAALTECDIDSPHSVDVLSSESSS